MMNIYHSTRKLALASAISLAILGSAGSLAESRESNRITEARQSSQIWTTYALNRHLKADEIEVNVNEGVATLTGTVSEDVRKEMAEQIALNVDGIKRVDNQIVVDADHKPAKASGERSYGEVIEDASITTIVKSKLLWSRHAQGLAATVETRSGKVTLTGTADSSEAKEMAGLLASNTNGVDSVQNKLKVEKAKATSERAKNRAEKSQAQSDRANGKSERAQEEASSLGQSISDTWITTKVKSTLAYSNLNSSEISVTTEEGIVTLSGKVRSDAEHALAVELAKNINGVKSVKASALSHS